MSFEVDRYSSAWAHIALCADLTWATDPPDEFIIANQRLWAQHCRVSQVLQDTSHELSKSNQTEVSEKRPTSSQAQENGSCSERKNVKDVIPESRLAQFYGNFYYDEAREKCYTNDNERANDRGYNSQGCEHSDLTECWMLPEVEYWFRKLLDEPADKCLFPRRRRQYKMLTDDDLQRSEWSLDINMRVSAASGRCGPGEAALAARVRAVRALWAAPPPDPPRKMRARRRQPRRTAPALKASRAPPRRAPPLLAARRLTAEPPQLADCQRALARLTPAARYRVAPRPRVDRRAAPAAPPPRATPDDGQRPSTSAADPTKRLYSTVLSTSAPAPLSLAAVSCARLSQKLLTPGLLKLNPKIVLRPPLADTKFEELEKEALEQYKASDESIDSKFRELEEQAVEQYSASNSNTSCGASAGRKTPRPPAAPDGERGAKSPPGKFPKEKSVDSVVIYSQNFLSPGPSKTQQNSLTNLKNFHTPPRGEKKEHSHRMSRSARGKGERAASGGGGRRGGGRRLASGSDPEEEGRRGEAARRPGDGPRGAARAGGDLHPLPKKS